MTTDTNTNKVNDLVQKLNDARVELERINAQIQHINATRTNDPVKADELMTTVTYLEQKKATLERIALGRAFALAYLLGASNKVSA